ncbi:Sphingomyelin phosphodiesterase [Orchesella cincta]|uniref:tryptophan--tRNA ligase n=1 Tax=Orchesella cincta TaxID=48709 RepID=A0A1D2MN19_ORCCI|nr:Sphingomyelin phosphodiesterase [Orchesella cincta]
MSRTVKKSDLKMIPPIKNLVGGWFRFCEFKTWHPPADSGGSKKGEEEVNQILRKANMRFKVDPESFRVFNRRGISIWETILVRYDNGSSSRKRRRLESMSIVFIVWLTSMQLQCLRIEMYWRKIYFKRWPRCWPVVSTRMNPFSFIQSHVPLHPQLAWVLAVFQQCPQLGRLPNFRDKSKRLKEVPLGLYTYPVLQAADILLYNATHVPVGEDNVQQIQFAQGVAQRFNRIHGRTFNIPKIMLEGGMWCRLRSLRKPENKMSKSEPDAKSRISLTDSSDDIVEKIKKAVTDFTSAVTYDPEKRPGVSNLIMIHSLCSGQSAEDICKSVQEIDTGKYKSVVAEAVVEHLKPIRTKMIELMQDPAYLLDVLKIGTEKAIGLSEPIWNDVCYKVGISPMHSWLSNSKTDNNASHVHVEQQQQQPGIKSARSYSILSSNMNMRFSLGFALIVALGIAGIAYGFTSEENELISEVMVHRDELRISIVNSLLGKNLTPKPKESLTCTLCHTLLLMVLNWIHQGLPDLEVATNVKDLCKTLNIVPASMCDDVVDQYSAELFYITRARPWVNRFDVCGILLGGSIDDECRTVNVSMIDWDVSVVGQKPPVVELPLLPENITTTKVLHLTDIHPDLHYAVGSLADCGTFLCCRSTENDDPSNSSISAGPWGDYREKPFSVTLQQDIVTQRDLTHHQIWNYTVEDNLAHYNMVFRHLREQFGDKTIYPVVGNHEPAPCNLFPTREVAAEAPQHNISWVYASIADEFSSSLTPEAEAQFRQTGYYTLVHKPGFRVIALNTNFCYTLNFWLIYSTVDPEGQLQWLSDTLDAAEKDNEVVWIIGHVPPGSDDCWYFWGLKYSALISRYESIIRAQFYGHTHNDDLRILFDMAEDPPRPTGALYISTSVTPYSYVNPGYKVFFADGARGQEDSTWEVVDYETWIYNVTQANLEGSPTLFKEYNAKEAFGLRSTRPADLYDLVVRMTTDDSLFQKFYRFWQMSYDGAEDCSTKECKLEYLCRIVQTDYTTINCERLEGFMNGTLAVPNIM